MNVRPGAKGSIATLLAVQTLPSCEYIRANEALLPHTSRERELLLRPLTILIPTPELVNRKN